MVPLKRSGPASAVKFKLVQTRRTFEEVTTQVRDLLFGGSLKQGDRLPPERELSEQLGVGRPALREALRALEVSGLIELRKGKMGGAFITGGDQKVLSGGMTDLLRLGNVSVEELFEAREWILATVVRPACRRITADELEGLRENVALAERLHAEGRYDQRIDTNFEFHTLIARSARNPFAVMMVQGMTDALRSLINKVGSDLAPNFFSLRRDLIKALASRDEDSASRLMARIVNATEQTYKRLVQQQARASTRSMDGQTPIASRPKSVGTRASRSKVKGA